MYDALTTFVKHLRQVIESVAPGVNFYPEPDKETIQYPCVVLHWGSHTKTKALRMWQSEVQIDVLFNQYDRAGLWKATQHIGEALKIIDDIPGNQPRIGKIQYLDEDGNKLNEPLPYIPDDSDVQWRLSEDGIQTIDEPDKPELKRNSFTLVLIYKNR